MKNNFNLDEFEAFLSESADQHRMYPSDRVWRNIDKELHGQKKWPALSFGALLTGAIITAGLILIHPDKTLFDTNAPAFSPKPTEVIKAEDNGTLTEQRHLTTTSSANANNDRQKQSSQKELNENGVAPVGIYSLANSSIERSASAYQRDTEAGYKLSAITGDNNYELSAIQNDFNSLTDLLPNAGISAVAPNEVSLEEIQITANAAPNLTEETLVEEDIKSAPGENLPGADKSVKLPAKQKQGRWGLEYYITPSYSYRYLTESKIVDLHQTQNGPIAPNLVKGVNNFVNHQPIFGMEAGAGVVYQATSNLQVTTGLQVSMRGYNIEAYAANREPSAIVLNRGYYTDSIFSLSSYSNQMGYKVVTLTNRYWQIALPVGINLQVANGKKLKLNIAASVQPTYQFNNSANVLSSDYKNYLSEPSLTRHWNVNTAIGAFVSYEAGGLNWRVGPQIRYQVNSGTVHDYPIKDHLLDYGLKIGVVKTLK